MASRGKIISGLRKIIVWYFSFMLVLLFIFSLQYWKIEVFYKEKNTPFSGGYLYNPYKDYSKKTLKANFHAHSKAWLNLTNGAQAPDEIYRHYKNSGYDIISLSNYMKISRDMTSPDYIPVYEKGINIRKSHQLVIDSKKVTLPEFSLFQNYHTQQQVLNKLRLNGGLIALAHPDLMKGYKEEDMKYLKGYDFIEVLNNYKTSLNIWDAALSSGNPAWILADDDCHDINRPGCSFNNWTRIGTSVQAKGEILNALERGCHYGVRNPDHNETNFLDSCVVKNNDLRVYFREKTDRIAFISDNGAVRKEVFNETFAIYKIEQTDSYVRVEAKTGDELIYLNPIIRYNGYQLTRNNDYAMVNSNLTILFRFLALILSFSILLLILILNKKYPSINHPVFRKDACQ